MKMKLALATILLATLPSLAAAMCGGESTASACAAGQVWDSETRTCVDTTT